MENQEVVVYQTGNLSGSRESWWPHTENELNAAPIFIGQQD